MDIRILLSTSEIPLMRQIGVPVIMDITHSLQQPNQEKGVAGGRPEMIETLGKAAISVGADGILLKLILTLQWQNQTEPIC